MYANFLSRHHNKRLVDIMLKEKKSKIKNEILMFLYLTFASAVLAFSLKSFVQVGGLIPGGFSGLAILIQQIVHQFLNVDLSFSVIYLFGGGRSVLAW